MFAAAAPATAAEPPAQTTSASAAGEASTDAAAVDPAGLLLFSVSLDGLTLSEGLGAYGASDDPLIPVGELTRLLEADVDVMPAERRIVGRLGEARRALLVDLKAGIARIAARDVPITPDDVAVTPTEIYLRISTLQKLLPVKAEVSSEELMLRLSATEKFPIQSRLDRMAKRPDGSPVPAGNLETLKITQPYALFSPPGMDVVLDGALKSGHLDRAFRYDLRLAGDLLWSNFQGFVGSDEQGRAATARAMLQRRSLEGTLLGPLHVREITAGDTYTPGLAMGPRSIAGRGISLSTAPLEQTNIFNRIDLRGELPPGYDVELYVNDVLKGGTNRAVQGRYEFLDVPLSPGVNVLRVVTYGPRGERNEEVQVVNVGAALLRPGEAQFAFGIVDQNQPLIRLRRLNGLVIGDPGLFADDGLRMVASLNYGISDLLSVTAGAARVPRTDGAATGVYTLGARTSLLGVATQADAGWDGRGGSGLALGLAGQVRGLSAVLRHAEYRDGFVDENNIGFSPRLQMERRTELTADTSLALRGRIMPVSLRVIRNAYADGSHELLTGARASSSLGTVLLSLGWEYQRQVYRPQAAVETLTGYIAASTYRSYKWQIRSTLDYDVLPDFKARFLSVTIDRRLTDAWSLRFGLGQPLDRLDRWNVVLSSILATHYGDLALTGEYDNSDADWRLSAQWSFGLGWDPDRSAYDLTRTGPGSGGSVLFNAFIDENGDGVRQAGEAPAPNVALEGGPRRGAVTGRDGRLLLTGLGAGPTAHMDVNLEKLDNSSVSTPPSRLELRPRPGSVARVNYPMRPTGEVMIKVELLRDDGRRVGLSSVRVQLVRDDTAPLEGVTEFDGSAAFDGVPVGAWRLQLEPLQARRLRMRLLEAPSVTIRGDGAFTPDVVIQVRFDPAPPETTVATGGGG
ncbi:MAG: hypothetical protein KKA30_19205 [Alphaproteobacteria bacterium]|nr:hypothetical protein [Alphaproteobacteria bacterium]MBU2307265.1 hypothetical protein [Alphaproteobacteria bacterium]